MGAALWINGFSAPWIIVISKWRGCQFIFGTRNGGGEDWISVNDRALERRGIRRMLEVWHFCRLNYFLCYSSGGFLRSSIANYSICDSVIFIISLLLHLIRFAILFCILFQINIDYGKLLSPNQYPPNPLNTDAPSRHSYFQPLV